MLEIKDLVKSFGSLHAVDHVNLKLEENELVGLIGTNGAGKTTLYNLITGRMSPDSGEVVFKGERIDGLSPHEIARKGIGLSFQIVSLFNNFSVFRNTRVPVISNEDRFYDLFNSVDKISEFEEKTNSILDMLNLLDDSNIKAKELPHGGKRRTDLALAFANDPQLLLLDEPTAGFGSQEVEEIKKLIKRLHEETGLTLIFTEHDLEAVFELSSRVIVMDQGEIITRGSPEGVQENEKVKEKLGV